MVGAAVVLSSAVLVAWFPGAQLLHQRHQFDAAAAQLNELEHQNRVLGEKAKELKTPSDVARIAEQQYDLVPSGQQAYQVLPKSGSGGSSLLATSTSGGRRSGREPGTARRSGVTTVPTSFLGRVLHTLEFWR